jgi:hypothetical protein
LENGSGIIFTSTTGRAVAGFGNMAGCTNAGTLKVFSGSYVFFSDLTTTGTLDIGSNVVLGGTSYGNAVNVTPLLIAGTGGTINVMGTNVVVGPSGGFCYTRPGGTLNIQTGMTLTLRFITANPGYAAAFSNGGTTVQSGGNLFLDWNDPVNNSVRSWFANSGTWTLTNGAMVRFTRQGLPYLGGFGTGTGNTNSGTLNVRDSSGISFKDLYNFGTINLGSSVGTVKVCDDNAAQAPVVLCGSNSTVRVDGDAVLGVTNATLGFLYSNGHGAAAGLRVSNARARLSRRRAQTNSTDSTASPAGMIRQAGPGRTIITTPASSTVPPITAMTSRRMGRNAARTSGSWSRRRMAQLKGGRRRAEAPHAAAARGR